MMASPSSGSSGWSGPKSFSSLSSEPPAWLPTPDAVTDPRSEQSLIPRAPALGPASLLYHVQRGVEGPSAHGGLPVVDPLAWVSCPLGRSASQARPHWPLPAPPRPGSESLSSCQGRRPCLSFSALRSSIYEVS